MNDLFSIKSALEYKVNKSTLNYKVNVWIFSITNNFNQNNYTPPAKRRAIKAGRELHLKQLHELKTNYNKQLHELKTNYTN